MSVLAHLDAARKGLATYVTYRRLGFLGVVLLAAYPLPFRGNPPFVVNVLVEVYVLAIFAMSFNLLMGYTGYVSFGHTAFLGAGAYATALLVTKAGVDFPVAAVLAIAATAAISVPIGRISFQRTGVYFAMITLGVAQIAYTIFRRWNYVGGTTGLRLDPPELLGYEFDPFEPLGYYYLGLVSVVVVYLFIGYVVRSPFGHVLRAIRENEARAEAVGYDVMWFKVASFTLAGAIAGYAGVLYAAYFSQVAPQSTLYWTTTGQGLFMVLIGGIGTLSGPILGAFFVVGLQYLLSTYLVDWLPAGAPQLLREAPERWPLFLGLIFMATVLYFPRGIAGGLGITGERSLEGVLRGEDGD